MDKMEWKDFIVDLSKPCTPPTVNDIEKRAQLYKWHYSHIESYYGDVQYRMKLLISEFDFQQFERLLIGKLSDNQKKVVRDITYYCMEIIKEVRGMMRICNIYDESFQDIEENVFDIREKARYIKGLVNQYQPDCIYKSEQPQPEVAQPQPLTIPDTLLNALQQAGFIENAAARPLKWLGKSKALLAYFVDVANEKLKLKDSGGRRQIKPFETLFNETGLQNCINEYKNKTGQFPQGYTDIDKIFSNLKY